MYVRITRNITPLIYGYPEFLVDKMPKM